ncbi:MAG: pyridoxamine 5'-phosphate oxidase family protein, partial [Pseudomonadota bacterium]
DLEAGEMDFPCRTLPEALGAVWQAFESGARDRRHAFHTPGLVTVGLDGSPKARIVVLRAFDRQAATLRCHTDLRSPKVSELAADPRVSVLAYDSGAKLQVRLEGTAEVQTQTPSANAAWTSSTLWARRCYSAPFAPGDETGEPHGNLPDDLSGRQPTEQEAEAGRDNFAIVQLTVEKVDWLFLEATGHRRGLHVRSGSGGWTSSWIAP